MKIDIQTRFTDYDMFGHVNNGAYLQYMDLAKARFLTEELDIPELTPYALATVIANINCDFIAPTVPNEPVSVITTISHIGDKSFIFEQKVINPDTDELKAHGRSVMVTIDVNTKAAVSIPQQLRDKLEAAMPNEHK
jgi:acyl-CoA thioester hydrolase